jgi:hydrogenase maturation protease
MRVTVIGIGQSMRGDDAAGIEAVRRWERVHAESATRPDITVQYGELPGLGLLDLLEGFDAAVIVDALESTAVGGTVFRLGPDELEAFGTGAKSAHGWGVAETLQMGQQLNRDRQQIRIRLVGIAAEHLELGTSLSDPVEKAMPAACEAIEAEVQDLLTFGLQSAGGSGHG